MLQEIRALVGDAPDIECGGDVLIGPRAIVCLLTLEGLSRLATRESFEWRPTRDARAPDERYSWLPIALRDAREQGRQLHLFARASRSDPYEPLGPAHMWSYGGRHGRETARFSLKSPLTAAVAHKLGHAPAPADALLGAELARAIAAATDPRTRFALARRFAESWHGRLPHTTPTSGAAVEIWHALHEDIAPVNGFLECQPRCSEVDGEVFVFHSENQGVIQWGVRLEERDREDPPVFGRFDDEWFEDSPSLSAWALRFVIAAEVFDCRGVSGWTALSDELEGVVARLEPAALPDVHWPAWRTRLLTARNAIAVVSGIDDEAGGEIWIATRDDETFDAAVEAVGLTAAPWEVTRR